MRDNLGLPLTQCVAWANFNGRLYLKLQQKVLLTTQMRHRGLGCLSGKRIIFSAPSTKKCLPRW